MESKEKSIIENPSEDYVSTNVPQSGIDPIELTKELEKLETVSNETDNNKPREGHENEKLETVMNETDSSKLKVVHENEKLETENNETDSSKPKVVHEDEKPSIEIKPKQRTDSSFLEEEKLKCKEEVDNSVTIQGRTGYASQNAIRTRASKFLYEKSKIRKFTHELFRGLPYDAFIKSFISSNDVVIFAKSWCPWCKKAHHLLAKNKVEHSILYIDLLEKHCEEIQKELEEISGQTTVPNIFIHQKHIGGYNELFTSFQTGLLNDYLRNEFDPYEYDLIVIGGGSGGIATVLEAAKFKKKIALCDYVEPSPHGTSWGIGGTCVNVGCIPKKIMHHAALIAETFIDAPQFGWGKFTNVRHNWNEFINNLQDYLKSLNWNYRKKLKAAGVDYFNARAKFIDPHSIKLETDDPEKTSLLTSKCFVIAVGCRPTYPKIEGSKEYCITSDDFFSLPEFPGKTLIIGGSYIALECAGILNHLGVCVTVMIRSISLRGFDREMAKRLEQHMELIGVTFIRKCKPLKITKNSTVGYHAEGQYVENDEIFEDDFDTVMFATGRKPNTSHLGLCKINIKVDRKSRKIITDHCEQTNLKHIFAIGDVALGRPQLTPVAIKSGKYLVRRLFGASNIILKYKYIPTNIFTPLEYGCVGETEESAREIFGNRVVIWHSFLESPEVLITKRLRADNYVKLVCLRMKSSEGIRDRVIGFHVLGYNAGEMTQGFTLAISNGLYKHNFDAYAPKDITGLAFSRLVQK